MAQTDGTIPDPPLVEWFDSSHGDTGQSPAQEEALARLHFLVEHRRRLGLVLGARGTGKSLLLNEFSSELHRQGHPVVKVNLLGLDAHEFVWEVAAQLGVNPRVGAERFQIWRGITDRLTEYRYQQVNCAVILDDADRAAADILTHVERLLLVDPSPDARMTMILAADECQLKNLGPRLLGLAELRIDLEGWQPDETAEYLRRWLATAGQRAPTFDHHATLRIHQLGEGNPRRIHQLAQLAMLAGKGDDLPTVDEETVNAVHSELSVGQQDN